MLSMGSCANGGGYYGRPILWSGRGPHRARGHLRARVPADARRASFRLAAAAPEEGHQVEPAARPAARYLLFIYACSSRRRCWGSAVRHRVTPSPLPATDPNSVFIIASTISLRIAPEIDAAIVAVQIRSDGAWRLYQPQPKYFRISAREHPIYGFLVCRYARSLSLAARQNTPAIDGAFYRPNRYIISTPAQFSYTIDGTGCPRSEGGEELY